MTIYYEVKTGKVEGLNREYETRTIEIIEADPGNASGILYPHRFCSVTWMLTSEGHWCKPEVTGGDPIETMWAAELLKKVGRRVETMRRAKAAKQLGRKVSETGRRDVGRWSFEDPDAFAAALAKIAKPCITRIPEGEEWPERFAA